MPWEPLRPDIAATRLRNTCRSALSLESQCSCRFQRRIQGKCHRHLLRFIKNGPEGKSGNYLGGALPGLRMRDCFLTTSGDALTFPGLAVAFFSFVFFFTSLRGQPIKMPSPSSPLSITISPKKSDSFLICTASGALSAEVTTDPVDGRRAPDTRSVCRSFDPTVRCWSTTAGLVGPGSGPRSLFTSTAIPIPNFGVCCSLLDSLDLLSRFSSSFWLGLLKRLVKVCRTFSIAY
mmetsp:Transcript_17496/g.27080  ORF Transcript_17496/g.27080 Transcript_17496/m.27080 type:complete len:234 (+) Transcript_17496:149-850(+)